MINAPVKSPLDLHLPARPTGITDLATYQQFAKIYTALQSIQSYVGALSTAQVAGLTTQSLPALTTAQLPGLTTAQLSALNTTLSNVNQLIIKLE